MLLFQVAFVGILKYRKLFIIQIKHVHFFLYHFQRHAESMGSIRDVAESVAVTTTNADKAIWI